MQTYTLTEVRNQHGKIFDRAKLEPVLITKQKRPSHVILSAEAYQKLIEHIQTLTGEDQPPNPVSADNKPRIPGLLQGKLSDTFFEPLPESELQQWEIAI
ncbi:prevent-host-death family protein [[Leptolyngbya] sp. PCC 7376]|uniref:type II toxin-antitoxin system Phd/YefM family antitoxin n=1 Tax=[Leptolyngbya] sp. PCC 7376 TaxID=111781 RepID=UPI00029F436B|nr:type II toxin-antitoxin system Phd/YefM family antitoxin [[Leptolyngbya] sp. PCC 7376]AFY37280.1 prevent-host-death family protein [[Leptolyngbya] sp. PCC 7376]